MDNKEPLLQYLNKAILYSVKFLAILMTFVIIWGTIDVVIILIRQMTTAPYNVLDNEHLLEVFGAFLTVLIAIEIFLNIVIYITKDRFQVELVLATALTAAARKVIVMDYNHINPLVIYAIAGVIITVGVAYWLAGRKNITDFRA